MIVIIYSSTNITGSYRIDYCFPLNIPELYGLAIELNKSISSHVQQIIPVVSSPCHNLIKNLLHYQQVEGADLIALLHYELNEYYRVFYEKKNSSVFTIDSGIHHDFEHFLQESLETFIVKMSNLQGICNRCPKIENHDFLTIYLGLRDYCANFYQQLAFNYRQIDFKKACSDIAALTDKISDEIGQACQSIVLA